MNTDLTHARPVKHLCPHKGIDSSSVQSNVQEFSDCYYGGLHMHVSTVNIIQRLTTCCLQHCVMYCSRQLMTGFYGSADLWN